MSDRSDNGSLDGNECNETTEVVFDDGSRTLVHFRGVPAGLAMGSAAWKKEKRLSDNRASAARSRALARFQASHSERQIIALQSSIDELSGENAELRSLLRLHAPHVQLPPSVLVAPSISRKALSPDATSHASSVSVSPIGCDDADDVDSEVSAGSSPQSSSYTSKAKASTGCRVRKAPPAKHRSTALLSQPPSKHQPASAYSQLTAVPVAAAAAEPVSSDLLPGHPLVVSALLPGLDDDSDIQLLAPPPLAERLLSMAALSEHTATTLAAPLPFLSREVSFGLASAALIPPTRTAPSSPFSQCLRRGSGSGFDIDIADFSEGGAASSSRPPLLTGSALDVPPCVVCGIGAGFCICATAHTPAPSPAVGSKRRGSSPDRGSTTAWDDLGSLGPLSMSMAASPRAACGSDNGGFFNKKARSNGASGGGGWTMRGGNIAHGLMVSVFCIALCGFEPTQLGDSSGEGSSSNSVPSMGFDDGGLIRIGGRSLFSVSTKGASRHSHSRTSKSPSHSVWSEGAGDWAIASESALSAQLQGNDSVCGAIGPGLEYSAGCAAHLHTGWFEQQHRGMMWNQLEAPLQSRCLWTDRRR